MLKDCQYKSAQRCSERPGGGLGGVVHCVLCHLQADREGVAERMREHERQRKLFQERQAVRLERLRREFVRESK